MPELPEVETIRQDLRQKILGKIIAVVEVASPKTVGGQFLAEKFCRQLRGRHFTDIGRIGKLLVFHTDHANVFVLLHLKMTGQLIFIEQGQVVAGGHSFSVFNKVLPDAFTRIVFSFSNGSKLFFNDARLFGYAKLADKKTMEAVVGKFGIEPLQENFTLSNFAKAVGGRRTTIKAILLNQALIAGIGNIYADEICHAASVLPHRRAATLSAAEIKRLYQAALRIIKKAILFRGTTFNNYRDSEGRKGKFSQLLRVYERVGKPCRTCKKSVIQKSRVAGRGTHWCGACQA